MARRTIVCLCGSTRFYKQFVESNLQETLRGNIVLSIGAAVKSDDEHFAQLTEERRAEVKRSLDLLHLDKIQLADEVLILNVDGYVGESTARELVHAANLGKTIRWLEPDKIPIWWGH